MGGGEVRGVEQAFDFSFRIDAHGRCAAFEPLPFVPALTRAHLPATGVAWRDFLSDEALATGLGPWLEARNGTEAVEFDLARPERTLRCWGRATGDGGFEVRGRLVGHRSEILSEGSARDLERFSDQVATGLMIVDDRARVHLANQALMERARLKPVQVLGMYAGNQHVEIRDASGAPLNPKKDAVREALRTLQPQTREQGFRMPWSDRVQVVQFTVRPVLDDDGNLRYLVCTVVDVTERVEAHQEALDAQKRLHEEIGKLARYESLSVLAGGFAHDFNNLLVGVLGAAALAQEHTLPREVGEQLRIIEEAGERAAELTRQLLTYAGRTTISVKPIDLIEVVRGGMKLMQTMMRRGVRVEFSRRADQVVVEADESQVRQAVLNLVLNAAEATEGAGTIHVRVGTVDLDDSSGLSGRGVFSAEAVPGTFGFVEVEDEGAGMDEAVQDRMFDPFFTTRPQRHGLGLAAVQGLAKAHRGAVWVDSEPGRGTRVRLGLPRQPDGTPPAGVPVASRWRPRKVLVVEDEDMVAQFVERALHRKRIASDRARDGQEGVEMFDAGRDLYDALMIDLTMPRLNGEKVLEHVRVSAPRLPVVIMSGFTPERPVDPEGPTVFIQKPFRPAQLESLWDELAAKA